MNELNVKQIFFLNKQLLIILLFIGIFSCAIPDHSKIKVFNEAIEFAPVVRNSHDNIYQQVITKHSKTYDQITMTRFNKELNFRVLGYNDNKNEEIDVGNHENRKYLFQKLNRFYYYSDSLVAYFPSASKNPIRYGSSYYHYLYFFNIVDIPSDCMSCDSLKANFDRKSENLDCMLDKHWMIRMDFDPSN